MGLWKLKYFGILIFGSIYSAYRGNYMIPVIVFAAGFSYTLRFLESENLWNYLLAIYAIILRVKVTNQISARSDQALTL